LGERADMSIEAASKVATRVNRRIAVDKELKGLFGSSVSNFDPMPKVLSVANVQCRATPRHPLFASTHGRDLRRLLLKSHFLTPATLAFTAKFTVADFF